MSIGAKYIVRFYGESEDFAMMCKLPVLTSSWEKVLSAAVYQLTPMCDARTYGERLYTSP